MIDGLKYDDGKVRLELVPPSLMLAVGEVLTYGAKKYEANSWRGVSAERYKGALLRHLMAYMGGEIHDTESGLPHLWHVACNVAFLIELDSEVQDDNTDEQRNPTEYMGRTAYEDTVCVAVCNKCRFLSNGWSDEPCASCMIYLPRNFEEES